LREDGAPAVRTVLVATGAGAALLLASLGYGSWRLGQETTEPGPKVCLAQCNISMERGVIEMHPAEMLKRLWHLSADALREEPDVDLVVWPETMLPGELRLQVIPLLRSAEDIPDPDSGDRLLDNSIALARDVRYIVGDQLRCAALVGWHVSERDATGRAVREYNSAVFLSDRGTYVDRYDKIHLVPFGEFTPLRRYLPFVVDIIESKVGQAPNLTPGRDSTVFELNGTGFGATICYEDTFPYLTRRLVQNGARFVLNLTNDAWFENSPELDMHAAICVFRAVENRVPVARAANTGVSCVIDSCGRITRRVQDRFGFQRQVEGALVDQLRLDKRRTLYTATGDLAGWVCALFTAAAVGALLRRRIVLSRSAKRASPGGR